MSHQPTPGDWEHFCSSGPVYGWTVGLYDTLTDHIKMSHEMKEMPAGEAQRVVDTHDEEQREAQDLGQPHSSKLVRFYAHPWTQILLISFICFCLPGVSCLSRLEHRDWMLI